MMTVVTTMKLDLQAEEESGIGSFHVASPRSLPASPSGVIT